MEELGSEEADDLQLQVIQVRQNTNFCSVLRRRKKLIIMVSVITFIVLLAIVLTTGIIPSTISTDDLKSMESKSSRLPTNVKPIFYKLEIIPYPDPDKNFTVDGKVKVDIICKEENTNSITLHIKKIEVNETSVFVVTKSDNRKLSIIGHEYDTTRDFYTVSLGENLQLGYVYSLYIEYIAVLSDELVGFYRSSYVDKSTNETRWLGVTQFSPTDARRAFPCFDEPGMKAEFGISLGRNENMTSISNMNLFRTEPIDGIPGWKWDHYVKTPLMSTYLVGLAVTDFIPKQSNTSLSKTKFQVWSRKDAISQTEYARSIGPRILTHFETYFGIDFPLPKLDIIGLPDHRFSAMENWGLVTFRELFILFDSKLSSDFDKRKIAEVVSHELAHQWFGNLVTPYWWSDLWLKEGFASYVAYIGVTHVAPEWNMINLFVTNELQTAFQLDALNASHHISIPVNDSNQINQIFDDISYKKGCTIIRMMDHFLTNHSFKQGITNYLNKWKYNNTKQEDLWQSLTEQAHKDGTLPEALTVGDIMDTWTLQKGYPVIQIERNYGTNDVKFEQSKFQLLGINNSSEFDKYKWWVPISIASLKQNSDFSETKPTFWIEKDVKTKIQNLDIGADDWLIANVQETGYYRVNYDLRNWQSILTQLKTNSKIIHVVNRAQIIDDSLTLSRATLLPYEFTLNLTNYLKNEVEYLPWSSFVTNLIFLSNMLLNTPAMPNFKIYVKELVKNEYERIGFLENESDSVLVKAHRGDIIKWACIVGITDCVNRSSQIFKEWMLESNPIDDNPIPVNLRGNIYCTAIKNGGENEWNFAWQKYLETNVASEKDTILKALACSNSSEILEKYMNWAITPGSGVRKQDSRNVLQQIGHNKIGNPLVFQLLRDKWAQIKKYYGSSLSIDRLIDDGISTKLNTPADLAQLEKFKSDHEFEFGYGTRAVEKAIEIVKTNIFWMNTNFEAVAAWLEHNAATINI